MKICDDLWIKGLKKGCLDIYCQTAPLNLSLTVCFWMEGGRPMFEFSHSTDGVGNSFVPRLKVKGMVELSDGWLLTADGKPSVTGHGRRNLPPLAEVYIQCKEPCGCKQKVANFG